MSKALMAAVLAAAFLVTAGILPAGFSPRAAAQTAKKPPGQKSQTGTIIGVNPLARTFICEWNKKNWTYQTTDKTSFRTRGAAATLADLKVGTRVNVGYRTVDNQRVADWVIIEQR
jgi:hypothetical protein